MGAKEYLEEMGKSGVEVVTVPRALLSCCLGVLQECDKHMPITGSNFDDDMGLCVGQLQIILLK